MAGQSRLRAHRRTIKRVTVLATVPALVVTMVAIQGHAVSGNISPNSVQIDGGSAGADLYSTTGTPLNSGATVDWVADSTDNVSTGCLSDSLATCNEAGVTAATNGVGHWTGARVVDGVNGDDKDIFLQGGKENDTSTWNVGPGTVGSSKYDATQAYIANNASTLFFGMERRGNNGTTAFDFEFNQKAPVNDTTYVPKRSNGDVLFTFELSGSGSSGSAMPHVYHWSGNETTQVGSFVEGSSAGILTSINNASTTAAPWGYVNSHGNWVLGSLDRFEFAEAAVSLSTVFSAFDPCGNAPFFTQVRTRSSATDTSDLKDTTKIFSYSFTAQSAPGASKTSMSASGMSVTLTGTSDTATTNKQWQKTTGDPTVEANWANIANATGETYTYSGFDTDVPLASAPVVAFSSGTSVAVANTTNANGSYVGKVQTVYIRLAASRKTGTACTLYSDAVAVHKVQLVDP